MTESERMHAADLSEEALTVPSKITVDEPMGLAAFRALRTYSIECERLAPVTIQGPPQSKESDPQVPVSCKLI